MSLIHPTAFVDPAAELAADVEVGPFSLVCANARIESGGRIGSHCVIGEGNRGRLVIGANANIRSHTVIYGGSTFGPELETGHHVTMREHLHVGRNLRVGTGCDLQGEGRIGNFVRMVANVHITQYSVIEDFAWLFAWILTTNDPHPPSDPCLKGVHVGRAALLTSNVTTLPGVHIGDKSFVAAGSLVTKDVEPERIVRGTPARDVGSIYDIACTHGHDEIKYPWWSYFRRGYPAAVTFTAQGPQYEE